MFNILDKQQYFIQPYKGGHAALPGASRELVINVTYMHSTKTERNHFLDMAIRLVASDKKISPKENLFLNELFNAWEEEIAD